jgi:hypothetical protein
VLAQYQSVNQRATSTANTPFQTYGGEFVAPVNSQQQTGIAGTNAAANEAQPYFDAATGTLANTQANTTGINNAATGLAAASAEQVNPTALTGADINQYLSPYLSDVVGSESALLNQNNQEQQAGQLGTAISSGAFGGDRTGLAAANLEQQQNLANANIYSGLLNTGYNTALSAAQQQQGVGLAAGQANRAALASAGQELSGIGSTTYGEGANTATTLAGLGTGAQTAGLQGANAQIAAGTVQQQTQQAQDTAEYNQFLQQQSYPFQVDQFLANIAEGTGALSGSTTTTTQPGGFFSDERLKHSIKKIGETYDHQPIYSYKMHGDDRTHVGLIAQKVEKKHPEAVGVARGYKIVDYGRATEDAANRGHFYEGGVVPMRRAYAGGGGPYASADVPYDSGGGPYGDGGYLSAVLASQRQMYQQQARDRQIPNQGGVAGHQLAVANGSPTPPQSGESKVTQTVGLGKDAYQGYKYLKPKAASTPGGGVSPSAADAAAEGPATDTAAAQAAQAGAAASAAPAAADAAPAATSAAGAGAGDAAATTAATTAAGVGAEAAVDTGAADAAAALAAEYGLADAVVAAAAAKRGGTIKRPGLAPGGTPYESMGEGTPYATTDGYLAIPDDENSAKLQTAGALKKQPTGLQTALTLGNPNDTSGLVGSMFSNQALATGGVAGRRGYDDGGDVDPNADPDVYSPQGVGRGVINRNPKVNLDYTRDPSSPIPYASPPPNADMGGEHFGVKDPNEPWSASEPPPSWIWKHPSTDAANTDMGGPNFGMSEGPWGGNKPPPAPVAQTGLGGANVTDQDVPTPTSRPVPYTGGVSPSPAPPIDASTPSPISVDKPSWWDKIKGSELAKPENLIPLLTAIGTMGTTPTRSLGVALSAGLLGGTKSYLNTRQQQADIGQTQASTGMTKSETQGQDIQNLAHLQSQYALQGFALQEDPNGPVQGPNGKRYRPVPKGSLIGNGATSPAPQYQYLGKNGVSTAAGEGVRYSTLDEPTKADSQKQIAATYEAGNSAQANMLQIQRWEQSMAANKGILDGGALSELRTKAANLWDTAAQRAGHPEFQISGLPDAQIADKVSRGAAAMSENEHQQRSFGALRAFLASTPNPEMQRQAALPLIADLHTENQMAIDKKNYLDEFDKENQRNYAPIPGNYLARDALQSFDKDYPANNYQGERNKLSTIIQSGGFQKLSSDLQNQRPHETPDDFARRKQKTYEALDKKYGPNFHRYFTGS